MGMRMFARVFCVAAVLTATGIYAQPQRAVTDEGKGELIAMAGPVALAAHPVTVVLTSGPGAGPKTLGEHLSALAGSRHIYLVLSDLSAENPPGVLYGIYLNLPPGQVPGSTGPHLVGYLNFYNAQGGSGRKTSRSFDITDIARKLHNKKLLTGPTTITIHPIQSPPENAKAVIGRIELVKCSETPG